MRRVDLELAVGIFLLAGIAALAYLSVRFGKLEITGGGGYNLYAEFQNSGGIKPGADVEIAGVSVGRVNSISLDPNYEAMVELSISNAIKIQEDAIASIKTKGLIGEKYIQISPGASEHSLSAGQRIRETESAVNIEDLISRYIFGKV